LHVLFTQFDEDPIKAQKVTQKLIHAGLEVNKINKSGQSALHVAVAHNQHLAINFALSSSKDLFNVNLNGGY
jgi:ankyrin repeat protein